MDVKLMMMMKLNSLENFQNFDILHAMVWPILINIYIHL